MNNDKSKSYKPYKSYKETEVKSEEKKKNNFENLSGVIESLKTNHIEENILIDKQSLIKGQLELERELEQLEMNIKIDDIIQKVALTKKSTLDKGFFMEELLRNYFLKAGYYVVRGVPFVYESFDVTDIDLWLYGRTSSVSREITIVDIKNRSTPKAIERIFWINGLKEAVEATTAIVATTDNRDEVRAFGKKMNVMVLDGSFLSRLKKSSDSINASRLNEEEFNNIITNYKYSKIDGDWKGRIRTCKGLLAKGLSFDNCNVWLAQAAFFAEQVITKPTQNNAAFRCFSIIASFFVIGVDYILKELSFFEQNERAALLTEGFTYGTRGRRGMESTLNVAMSLVEEFAAGGNTVSKQVKFGFERELESLKTAALGEYFSKNEVSKNLVVIARELELIAMSKNPISFENVSYEVKGVVYCLLDFMEINRSLFSKSSSF